MNVYKLECRMVVPVSVQEAFAVFENPYNLSRITPPWLNFRILTPDIQMAIGAEMEYRFRWNAVPLYWKTKITEYVPPFQFVDEALTSPYRFWRHRHTFRPVLKGTLVSDRVDYGMRFGLAGKLAHEWSVRRQLERIFEFRQKALGEILGAGVTELQQPVVTAAP